MRREGWPAVVLPRPKPRASSSTPLPPEFDRSFRPGGSIDFRSRVRCAAYRENVHVRKFIGLRRVGVGGALFFERASAASGILLACVGWGILPACRPAHPWIARREWKDKCFHFVPGCGLMRGGEGLHLAGSDGGS